MFDILKALLAQKGQGKQVQSSEPEPGNSNYSGRIPPSTTNNQSAHFSVQYQVADPFAFRSPVQHRISGENTPAQKGYFAAREDLGQPVKRQIPVSQSQPISGQPPGTNKTLKGSIPSFQQPEQLPYSNHRAWQEKIPATPLNRAPLEKFGARVG